MTLCQFCDNELDTETTCPGDPCPSKPWTLEDVPIGSRFYYRGGMYQHLGPSIRHLEGTSVTPHTCGTTETFVLFYTGDIKGDVTTLLRNSQVIREHAAEGLVTYVAVAGSRHGIGGAWGRGDTEQAALVQCRNAGARAGDPTVIYRNVRPSHRTADKFKPYVDDGGSVAYFGALTKVARYERGKRRAP